jgi:hypothetical protein
MNRKILRGMNVGEAALFSEKSVPFTFETASVFRETQYRELIGESKRFHWIYEMAPVKPQPLESPLVSDIPKEIKPVRIENNHNEKDGGRGQARYFSGPGTL